MGKAQEALAEYFEDQARQYEAKAAENPYEVQHLLSARSWLKLAAEAHELPDDHPLVVAVKDQVEDTGVVSRSDGSWQYAIERYVFDPVPRAPSDFLVELAALWRRDESER
jgi:hypothetical protein